MGPKKRLRVKKANKSRFKSHQEASINCSECFDTADSIEDGSDGGRTSGCGIKGCVSATTTRKNNGPPTPPNVVTIATTSLVPVATSVTTCTTKAGVSPKVGVSSMSSKMRVSPKVGVSHTAGLSPKVGVSPSSVPVSSSPGTVGVGVSPGITGVGVSPKVNGSFTVTYDYTAEQEGDHTHKSMEELAQLFSFQNEQSKFHWKTSTPPAPTRSVKRLRPLPDSAVPDPPSKADGNISHLVATLRARISEPHPPDVAKQSHDMDKPHLPDVAKQSHDMDKPYPLDVAKLSEDMNEPHPPDVAELSHDMGKPRSPELTGLCIDEGIGLAMQDQLDGFLEEEDLMVSGREEEDEEQSFWTLAAQQLGALTNTSSGTGNSSSTSTVSNSSTGVSTRASNTQDTGHVNHPEVGTIDDTLPQTIDDTFGTTVDDLLPVDIDEFQSEDVNVHIPAAPEKRGPNSRLRGSGRDSHGRGWSTRTGASQVYKNSIPKNSFSQGSALQYSVSPYSVSQHSVSQDLVSVGSVSDRFVSLRHLRTFGNSSAGVDRMDETVSAMRHVGSGEVRRGRNHRFQQDGCHRSGQKGIVGQDSFSMGKQNGSSTRGGHNGISRGRQDGYGRVRQDDSKVRHEGRGRGQWPQASKVCERSNGGIHQKDTRNRNCRESSKFDSTSSKERNCSDRGNTMTACENTMYSRIFEDNTNSKPSNGACADATRTGDDVARATGDSNLDSETECDLIFQALVKQSQ